MKKIFLVLIIMTTLFSCKKDEGTTTNPTTKTKTQYLTQKSWRDSIVLSRPDTNQAWTTVNFMPCRLDDITNFKTDFSWSYENGATKCNTTDPQIWETGTWSFTTNETHLNYNRNLGAASHTLDWKIEQLDDNIFVYTYFYFPSPVYYKITMVH